MEWGNIWAIAVLFLIIVFIGIWIVADKLRLVSIDKLGDRSVLLGSALRFSANEIIYKRLFLSLAVFFLAIALMQPRKQIGIEQLEIKSLDMVIALDTSLSMLAQDLKPNRLTRAKMEIAQLLDKIQGDRVALVVFSGQAFVQCPPTLDYYAFKRFLEAVDVDTVPVPGTNLADAIFTSLNTLEEEQGYKVIMLITDGEAFDEKQAIEAAKKAKSSGAKIYCIGIGTKEGEPIPLPGGGYKKDKQGQIVLTRLDEDLLIKIASITGGAYMRAGTGAVDVERMYDLIAKEKRQITKEENVPVYAEYFVYPAFLSLLCLLMAWFLPLNRDFLRRLLSKPNGLLLILVLLFSCGWKWEHLANNKAVKLYKKGRKEQAEKILESLKRKFSEDPVVNYNLGNVYYEQGKDPVACYQIASLSSDPTLKKYAFYNLGNYYLKSNKLKEAISAYQQALLVDPNFVDARYNLELALKKLQQSQGKKQNQSQQNRQAKSEKGKQGQSRWNKQSRLQQGRENQQNSQSSQGNAKGQQQMKKSSPEQENTQNIQNSFLGEEQNSAKHQEQKRSEKENQVYNRDRRQEKNEALNQEVWAILQSVSDEEMSVKDIYKEKTKATHFSVDKDW